MTKETFASSAGAAAAAKMPALKGSILSKEITAEEAERRKQDFENLIRGEYKQQFDERVQKIIDKRFREMRLMKEQAAKIKPLLDALSEKYGNADADALVKMLKEDAGKNTKIAFDRQLKAREQAMKWRASAEEIANADPEFNLADEMKNPAFTHLLKAGVDMKSAYHAMHHDEILEKAIRYAVKKVHDQTVKDMRMNLSRPEENGSGGRGGAKMAPPSVNNMTRAEREEIEKRAARGEKVYFS